MKTTTLTIVLFSMMCLSFVQETAAQVIYTSNPKGGRWSDPSTWTVTGQKTGSKVPTNEVSRRGDNNSNIIVINSPVILDRDYTVDGKDGHMTITSAGSLVEDGTDRRLDFAEKMGSDENRLLLNGRLAVSSISFMKADATINAPMEADCSIAVGNNATLTIGSTVAIDGNLVVRQGNPSLVGAGQLAIGGCVMTIDQGVQRGLFGSDLRVCLGGKSTNCGTENLKGMNCNDRVREAIAVNDCSPLPVQLVSFAARSTGGQVYLQWATASEINSASFAVERSVDGHSFEQVALVAAAGTSSARRNYTTTDAQPQPGMNYYRLRQVDLDGKTAYSQVLPVDVSSGEARQQMDVYGSLAGQPSLNVTMRVNGQCQAIRVLDSMGRLLYTDQLPANATGSVSRQLPLTASKPGIYIVQALTSEGVVSRRVLVHE
ncbi:T9SS type A sorting domain-containing protein [Hymenobacter sp. AT01-02]|uniref:T9SS type A sorting domain-containing protein n=1 Tax=Hymenobacter sp. AT01-02 TaxID=1571877 RepID=UPI000A924055|nr:T9SS type A sorting domain-containing protein [Hymenobacter sp. AT01-02]